MKEVIYVDDNAIQISRIHKVDGDSKLKAFVDLSLSGIVVTGLRVVYGSKGLFVGMPRHQGKDGKWYNTVIPLKRDIKDTIERIVLEAYGS